MKTSPEKFERRQALKVGLGVAGSIAVLPNLMGEALAACDPTPAMGPGPFYPVRDQVDKDADLTFVEGKDGKASGQVIYVQGTVTEPNCRPVSGALVEIWQTCQSGRYNHPRDQNTAAELDPFFQYWGMALTDQNGRYMFKTIMPGAYGSGTGSMRTPHIHYKIRKPGYRELITQMYFVGAALNGQDGIYASLSPEEQQKLTVQFEEASAGFDQGSKIGTFNISLQPS